MDLAAILKLAQTGAQLIETIAPLVAEAREVASTEDQAELDSALARVAAANDALHARLQSKLERAAQAG